MDLVKNYALKFLRESVEDNVEDQVKEVSQGEEATSEIKNEDSNEWSFNPNDEGMSGAATYTYGKNITLQSVGYDGGDLAPIESLEELNVMSPSIEEQEGQTGYFMLLKSEGQFGFEADFGENLDTMIYGYAYTMEDLKRIVGVFAKYTDLNPEEVPYEEFERLINAEQNEEDIQPDQGAIEVPAEISLGAEVPQEPITESRKFYTFTIDCPVTVVVTAESEEDAKDVLCALGDVEFDSAQAPELLDGDVVIAAVTFAHNYINSAIAHNTFDPES